MNSNRNYLDIIEKEYFLPYQIRWLDDPSDFKVWRKSRRIGATYVQSYEDVYDCICQNVPDVWFTSTDESNGREYIDYCRFWTEFLKVPIKYSNVLIIENNQSIKVMQITFRNGSRINALSSNPAALRGKGGKIVLDEFALHENADALWAAAKACTLWGYPLRIITTESTEDHLFYKMLARIKSGELNWSLHYTTIIDAVKQGLLDKIKQRPTTPDEREKWIEDIRTESLSDEVFTAEFMCVPYSKSSAFIDSEKYDLCTTHRISDSTNHKFELVAGMDVARNHDLSVIFILKFCANAFYFHDMIVMENTPFKEQRRVLYEVLSDKNLIAFAGDSTGIGRQLIEEAQADFLGKDIELVNFSIPTKEHLAYRVKGVINDLRIQLPIRDDLREDILSIKQINKSIYSISHKHHGDRFWALGLALYAGKSCHSVISNVNIFSSNKLSIHRELEFYDT